MALLIWLIVGLVVLAVGTWVNALGTLQDNIEMDELGYLLWKVGGVIVIMVAVLYSTSV